MHHCLASFIFAVTIPNFLIVGCEGNRTLPPFTSERERRPVSALGNDAPQDFGSAFPASLVDEFDDLRVKKASKHLAKKHLEWRGLAFPESAEYLGGATQFEDSDTWAEFHYKVSEVEAQALFREVAEKWRDEAERFSGAKMNVDNEAGFELFLAGRGDDFKLVYNPETTTLIYEEVED